MKLTQPFHWIRSAERALFHRRGPPQPGGSHFSQASIQEVAGSWTSPNDDVPVTFTAPRLPGDPQQENAKEDVFWDLRVTRGQVEVGARGYKPGSWLAPRHWRPLTAQEAVDLWKALRCYDRHESDYIAVQEIPHTAPENKEAWSKVQAEGHASVVKMMDALAAGPGKGKIQRLGKLPWDSEGQVRKAAADMAHEIIEGVKALRAQREKEGEPHNFDMNFYPFEMTAIGIEEQYGLTDPEGVRAEGMARELVKAQLPALGYRNVRFGPPAPGTPAAPDMAGGANSRSWRARWVETLNCTW